MMVGGLLLIAAVLVGALITLGVMLRSDHPLRVAIAGAVLTLLAWRILVGAFIGIVMLVLLIAFAIHGP
jgi:hypothetical protein